MFLFENIYICIWYKIKLYGKKRKLGKGKNKVYIIKLLVRRKKSYKILVEFVYNELILWEINIIYIRLL